MKLSYVDLCGFRSYRKRTRVGFASGFTIIDGRNGAGKSTLFDAVEFALTGTIQKYLGPSANRETVDDYVWWAGDGSVPADRFVEVGFIDDDGTEFVVRRTEAEGISKDDEAHLVRRLTHPDATPDDPLRQLCKVALIRDEHIAEFSLDLTESERFALVRQALGAIDADDWTAKGAALEKITKQAVKKAEDELEWLRHSRDDAQRRMDEARQNRRSDEALNEAADRLRAFTDTSAPAEDELISIARRKISDLNGRVESLRSLRNRWPEIDAAKSNLNALGEAVDAAQQKVQEEEAAVQDLPSPSGASSSDTAALAKELTRLVELGDRIGLRDDECPLCGCSHDEASFHRGLAAALTAARALDEAAVEQEKLDNERKEAEARLASSREAAESAIEALSVAQASVSSFESEKKALGLTSESTPADVSGLIADIEERVARAATDIRTLGTREYDTLFVREERNAKAFAERIVVAETTAGRARRAAATAKALRKAADRAALETLQERLERVQPLMSDLYQRLNPHPVWKNFDSVIRGKVKGYMRFQVGGQHNPQFIFSSGQRRATGLAFLLSFNLSLAWSKWQTVMLDDPVQHVDDFRAIHLAEVIGQFVREGKQIICAVEDAALADLLTRRLPNESLGEAQRLTLSLEPDGSTHAGSSRVIPPLPRHSITGDTDRKAAG